ncbi:MAG: hypothetical protein PHN55_12830 [Dysgonamonadaceae bacterium]|nr:hypothetical protein [Bacteroidales bacterium]MDD4729620.1 hypothetical protein [Dysgonamonadaceae bacterium]
MKQLLLPKIVLFFTLIIALSSCNSNKKLEKVNDIEFNIGYTFVPRNAGICYDYTEKKELIYFANPISQKCIKFFTVDGKLNDSITLRNAIKELANIDGISVISKDTIIINSQYTNRYVVVNRKGEVWLSVDMNELIDKTELNFYEFGMSSVSNSSADKNTLMLNCCWYYNKKDRMMNKEPKEEFANCQYVYNSLNESPYFFKVSGFLTSTPTVSFGLKRFYKKIATYSGCSTESKKYSLIGDYTYVFSAFLNTILKVNTSTMKIEKRIEVNSDYTTIGTPMPKITEESMYHLQDTVLINGRTKGLIARMYYSKEQEKYYVIVYHEVKNVKGLLEEDLRRHFSIIIYDKAFKKLHEEAFMDGVYLGWGALVTSQGLLIPKNNTNETKINNGKSTYTLFKYSD